MIKELSSNLLVQRIRYDLSEIFKNPFLYSVMNEEITSQDVFEMSFVCPIYKHQLCQIISSIYPFRLDVINMLYIRMTSCFCSQISYLITTFIIWMQYIIGKAIFLAPSLLKDLSEGVSKSGI